MEKENLNISFTMQNYMVSRKHCGKLELNEIIFSGSKVEGGQFKNNKKRMG